MNIIIIVALFIIIILLLIYIRKLETTTEIKRYYEKKINKLKKDPYKCMAVLRIEKNQEIAELRIKKNQEIQDLTKKLNELQTKYNQGIKIPIKQALTSSRNAFKREIGEIFCPFHEGFPYNVKDCTFIGNPIDYVIFNNLDAYRDGEKNIEDVEVLFFEIKTTHSAHLSKIQKAIKYAIENKKVKFKTYQYDEDTINKGKTILIEKYN